MIALRNAKDKKHIIDNTKIEQKIQKRKVARQILRYALKRECAMVRHVEYSMQLLRGHGPN